VSTPLPGPGPQEDELDVLQLDAGSAPSRPVPERRSRLLLYEPVRMAVHNLAEVLRRRQILRLALTVDHGNGEASVADQLRVLKRELVVVSHQHRREVELGQPP
jgi:hypothetical protein